MLFFLEAKTTPIRSLCEEYFVIEELFYPNFVDPAANPLRKFSKILFLVRYCRELHVVVCDGDVFVWFLSRFKVNVTCRSRDALKKLH